MRFGCSYVSIADCGCGATTIRERRDEWIELGIFARLKAIAREACDRIAGLVLEELAADGCIAKAPSGGECAGRSPVDRGKLVMKRSILVEGKGVPPDEITAHLDSGYDSQKTRTELESCSLKGEIARKGEKAPIQAGRRWPVERTNAWHNGFNRLQRCYEGDEEVIDAFFDLTDTIITLRRLIREAWTLYRWDTRPARRP